MFKAKHCQLMYLRTLKTFLLKYTNLILQKYLSTARLACQPVLKKSKVKLDLSTHFDMLLIVEKGIRGGICHSIY